MNILVVAHYGLYRHLSASFIHNQVKEFAAMGHRVRVIIPVQMGKERNGKRFGPLFDTKQADGVELCYLRFWSMSNFGAMWFNTPSAVVSLKNQLHKVLDGFQPDIIHAHTLGLDSGLGAWLKKELNIPLVVTTHGSDLFVTLKSGHKAWLKKLADQADTVICVSSLMERRLLECDVAVPVKVILNGFNVSKAKADQEKKPFSLIQAGYLVERKKADITIRAFAQLKDKYPEATLKIVGSGSELARFQALVKELGVEDSVCFTGYLPNPETLAEMAKAMFFVMPSVREGFGIVYLEAMASGCVTIGTQGEGIADLIENGKNGFLVPPEDPNAIVAVIESCLNDPQGAKEIADRGREDACALTWPANAQKYLELYTSLTQ